jgi:uncharacterized protein with HEPN domain
MKQPIFFLQHILLAITEIENYTTNLDKAAFINNPMCYNATIRQIEIIGEAIAKLETDFINKYPGIPWKDIIAMRNILIHEYWQTDIEEVFNTIRNDIPNLKKLIEPILAQLQSESL